MNWITLAIIIATISVPSMIIVLLIIRMKKKRPAPGFRPHSTRLHAKTLVAWILGLVIIFFAGHQQYQAPVPEPKSGPEPHEDPMSYPLPQAEILPEFPWPPPAASAFMDIDIRSDINSLMAASDGGSYIAQIRGRYIPFENAELFFSREHPLLLHADSLLRVALEQADNFEISYYAVPDGFALVSRLEQIEADGSPLASSERWETRIRRKSRFSVKYYLKALFVAPPGYYRLVVFVVTPHPFTQSDVPVTKDAAELWLNHGANSIPLKLALRPYTEHYRCTALIYEFEKHDTLDEAILRRPGRLDAKTHLAKSGIGRDLP